MYRRFFTALLSLCLVLALVPVPAARADTEYTVSILKQSYDNPNHNRWLGSLNGQEGQHQTGETVTISAPSMAGFQFQKWGDLSGLTIVDGGEDTEVIKFVMPAHDVSLEAFYFATGPVHQVRQRNNVQDGANLYYYATGAEFVALSNQIDGYRHIGWDGTEGLSITHGGNDQSGNIQFIMPDYDVTLTAVYEPIPNPFTDIREDNYFYYAVLWAVDKNITNGTSDTTFSPGNTCTTAQIITFLWRSQNSPEPAGANPFRDVDVNSYYGKAAVWAGEKGMVSGDTFNGSSPCTRAAVMQYLWILAGRPSAQAASFTDVPSGADYAQAVSWAVQRGITNGKTETTFAPNETCTRGQIATFLYRNSK